MNVRFFYKSVPERNVDADNNQTDMSFFQLSGLVKRDQNVLKTGM